MNKKLNLIIVGPALSISGYGTQTRFAIDSLIKSKKYNLYLYNTGWGKSNWICSDHPMRDLIDKLISKTTVLDKDFRADVSLQITYPSEFKMYSPLNIGYTAGVETDKVDYNWIIASNMMDQIIVPSTHSKNSFINAKYKKEDQTTPKKDIFVSLNKVPEVVGFPVEHDFLKTDLTEVTEKLSKLNTKYNFLTVAQVSPRKNIYNLVKYFLKEFDQNKDVSLTMKLHRRDMSTIDRFETEEKLSTFIKEISPHKKCKINLIHGDLSPKELGSLYKNNKITHYVSASHGEGFGLPILSAAAAGLVVVAPYWSGPVDFLNKGAMSVVKCSIQNVQPTAVHPGVINADAKWAQIEEDDFRIALRSSIENYTKLKKNAKISARDIIKKYSKINQVRKFNQIIDKIIKEKRRN